MDKQFNFVVALPAPLKSAAHQKMVAEQLYYISSKIDGVIWGKQEIILQVADLDSLELDKIRTAVLELVEVAASATRIDDEILYCTDFEMSPPKNPLKQLQLEGQVYFNSDGIPVFEGNFNELMKRLDRIIYNYACEIGSLEQSYPTTVPTASLLSNGYLKSFPQHALLVGSFHQDFASLRAIAEHPDKYNTIEAIDGLIDRHAQVLSPTVCYHCFERFRNANLDLRHRLITAIGKCHRHEGRNTTGLTRLRTYTMREIIYFGDVDFVVKWQEEILSWMTDLLSRFKISYRVVAAADPFFATDAARKKDYQRVFRLKYEVQAVVPQSGEWVSIASFNNHQKTLTSSYIINGDRGSEPLHSGCFGVGYERLAFCLVSQLGLSPSDWPKELQA